MLFVHDTLTSKGKKPTTWRVLWVEEDGSSAALIAVSDPNAAPFLIDMAQVEDMVRTCAWVLEKGEMPRQALDFEIPESHRKLRNAAFEVVGLMLRDGIPLICDKSKRNQRISLAMAAFGLSRPTARSHLRRFLQGGMSVGALTPRYARCGAPGETRQVGARTPKRGRPPAPGHPVGCNVDDQLRRVFGRAADIAYRRNRKSSLMDAWHLCVEEFLTVETVDRGTGKSIRVPKEEYRRSGLPTEGQFFYWVKRETDEFEVAKRRIGSRIYERTHKPKTGNSVSRSPGPAFRYEIDATVLDVYVRSRGNRRRLVGRPTLYVIIDVFSRMIVGIYIGLEHPSWTGAMMALANAIEDKVEFCKRFGVDIEPEEWPAQHICATLLGDGGEVAGAGPEALLRLFNITLEKHAPYRADWKGAVECRFKLIQVGFKPYVDGYIEADYRQRGGSDYRADAVLDIDEITEIIIRIVLRHNNHTELKKYPKQPGQVQDGVPSVPLHLWNWGIATKTGSARRPNVDRFKFAMMPRAEASATVEGIRFQGRYYNCAKADREHWYEKARKGRFKVPISYDKRDADRIYVHDESELGFEVAFLTDDSVACRGLTGWEVDDDQKEAAWISAQRRGADAMEHASTAKHIKRINAAAKKKADALPVEGSHRSQVQGARAARVIEVAADRAEEVKRTRPQQAERPTAAEKAPPVPAREKVPAPNDLAPGMAEMLEALGIDDD